MPGKFDLDSSLGAVYAHPAGRDMLDKILLQLNLSSKWITNVVVRNLRLGALRLISAGKLSDDFLNTIVDNLNAHPQAVSPATGHPQPQWWKEAVFYQIYPRSFKDSNGDGIGDLAGITSQLDYLSSLGVNALWLSPVYDSPNDDNGYDIRDYKKIMSEFGTMEDFDRLLEQAHQRNMRVIMDLVVNHTSDEHEWFQQALADPTSPYRDYYFFRPVSPNSVAAPNNWVSFFSGSAWRRFAQQKVWALHLFSSKQMDLNWENPQVRREVADIANWWLDKGVDGFRLDVINYISKEPGLPDGAPVIGELMGFPGIEQYFYGPRLHEYLHELNQRAFQPHEAFSVGETPGIGTQVGKLITDPDRQELDLIFNFDHLETPGHVRTDDYLYDLNYLKRYYIHNQSEYAGQYWFSLFFENHDNPRMVSKVNPHPLYRQPLAKLLGSVLLTLRGTPFLFQGQELGLVNQNFTDIEQLRDIESLNLYQELLEKMPTEEAFRAVLPGTRDHSRTPMPWTAEENAGFTTGSPWIVADTDYLTYNTVEEAADPSSVFNYYRTLINLRASNPNTLIYGDIEFLDQAADNYWAYLRVGENGQAILVQMNLSPIEFDLMSAPETQSALTLPATAGDFPSMLVSNYPSTAVGTSDQMVLAGAPLKPYEVRIWELR